MRKGVALFLVLVSLISMVSAECIYGDQGAHGVEIGDICYDCGVEDSVCPKDYGAECGVRDNDCSYTQEVFWSLNEMTQINDITIDMITGGSVKLIVTETALTEGTEVTFDIYEADTFPNPDDFITTVTGSVVAGESTSAVGIWDVTAEDIEKIGDYEFENPEFYFKATAVGLDSADSNLLNMTIVYGESVSVSVCGDYLDENSCIDDVSLVGNQNLPLDRIMGLCTYHFNGECSWETIGEESTCDRITWESEDASNPEECEDARGRCTYIEESREGQCVTEDFYTIEYTSSTVGEECPDWETQPIPCPVELKVPFFGIYSIIMTLSLIGLIYFFFRRDYL